MAVYVPVRPRWNPRGVVVNYVFNEKLCVRSWPRGYRDANSPAQRQQRGKMAQVCGVLPHLKNLLAEGYAARVKRNGRRVGSYHAAVATALREWFVETPRGVQLDTARLRLTDGVAALPEGLTVARAGDALRVSWAGAMGRRGAKLLLAARAPGSSGWLSEVAPLEDGATSVAVRLPAAWRKAAVEAWCAFVGDGGRLRTQTLRNVLPPKKGALEKSTPPGTVGSLERLEGMGSAQVALDKEEVGPT